MPDSSLTTEARALQEYWALRNDPVYRGEGVARGDGRLVLVLPGLFGNDIYLQPLRRWLATIGYRPAVSGILLNAGCPERIKAQVEQGFAKRLADHPGDVAIIGHSRGGMLGKALATRLGNRCTCFVALGSPLGALLRAGPDGMATLTGRGAPQAGDAVASQAVVDAGRRAMRLISPDCEFPSCDCSYLAELLAPLPATTRCHAIFSSDDPVVSPAASPIPGAVNVEVTGSHSGLVVNRDVYRHLATALAGLP